MSVARLLTTVDVQYLAGDELRALEVGDRVDDFVDLTQPAERVQCREELVRLLRVHRRTNDARRHRVETDPAGGVLRGEGLGDGVESALGERGQRGRDRAEGVLGETGGDVDDVAAVPVLEHRGDRAPGGVEEAAQVDT